MMHLLNRLKKLCFRALRKINSGMKILLFFYRLCVDKHINMVYNVLKECDVMTLKEKIIDFRAIKNLSQVELARLIGISPTLIVGIENENRNIRAVTKRKIEIYIENNQ